MNQEQPDPEPPIMLPKPQTEFATSADKSTALPVVSEKNLSKIVEKIHPKTQQKQLTQDQILNQAQGIPASAAQPQDDTGVVSQTNSGTSSLIADDIDLIEKEWVEKAKKIISGTIDDPYKQNIEINKVKAEYLKKRFNKEVKINVD